jgi:hypothetical protein
MVAFKLKQHPTNKLYAVYENDVRVKGYIFTGVEDFKQELKFLGFSQEYTVNIAS